MLDHRKRERAGYICSCRTGLRSTSVIGKHDMEVSMKIQKRVLCLLLCLLFVFGAAACGGNQPNQDAAVTETPGQPAESPTQTPTVAHPHAEADTGAHGR